MAESVGDPREAKLYEQIGRFLVAFEGACAWLRAGIQFVLQADGLETESLAQVLTNNRSMSVNTLLTTYKAVVAEAKLRETVHTKDVLDALYKKFDDELISTRHDIVHGEWSTLATDNNGKQDMKFVFMRPTLSRRGIEWQCVIDYVEVLVAVTKQAKEVEELACQAYCRLHDAAADRLHDATDGGLLPSPHASAPPPAIR